MTTLIGSLEEFSRFLQKWDLWRLDKQSHCYRFYQRGIPQINRQVSLTNLHALDSSLVRAMTALESYNQCTALLRESIRFWYDASAKLVESADGHATAIYAVRRASPNQGRYLLIADIQQLRSLGDNIWVVTELLREGAVFVQEQWLRDHFPQTFAQFIAAAHIGAAPDFLADVLTATKPLSLAALPGLDDMFLS